MTKSKFLTTSIKTLSSLSALLLATAVLSSCGQNSQFDEHQDGFFVAGNLEGVNVQALPAADQDLYHHVGLTMLVEQFEAENLPTMRAAIAANPPAGIVFWNPHGVGANELSVITRAYSQSARTASVAQPPLLLSTDYEGGGMTRTLRGTSVPGIQRFKTGLTLFPHGQWLGKEIETLNTDELCAIQGEAMGRELGAVGINYPLATVSDLAGGLFINRGISTNPQVISRCLNKMIDNFNTASGGHAIFVTKHFPGLGFTQGDTHEMTVTSSRRGAEFDRHIQPYREVLARRRQMHDENLLSVMVGHAQFTAFSPRRTSTESSYILKNVLKSSAPFQEQDGGVVTAHQGLGFSGLVLSDAMWMGVYGFVHQMATRGRLDEPEKLPALQRELVNDGFFTGSQLAGLSRDDYQRVYNVLCLNTLLSGMDILMIPNVQFAKVVLFLRKGLVHQWDSEELRLIQARTGLNPEQAEAALHQRLTEIIAKNRSVRSQLNFPAAYAGAPSQADLNLKQRMMQVLHSLDSAW